MITLLIAAIVVGFIAWMIIPAKPKGPKPTDSPSSAAPAPWAWPAPPPTQGPFAASVEEKMAVVESELRARQADKYRKQVIEEVAELVSSNASSSSASKASK